MTAFRKFARFLLALAWIFSNVAAEDEKQNANHLSFEILYFVIFISPICVQVRLLGFANNKPRGGVVEHYCRTCHCLSLLRRKSAKILCCLSFLFIADQSFKFSNLETVSFLNTSLSFVHDFVSLGRLSKDA
jgi:hypothetical protein